MLPEDFKMILPQEKLNEAIQWWDNLSQENQQVLSNFYTEGESSVIQLVEAVNEELEHRERISFEADIITDTDALEFPNQDYYENLIGNEVYLCVRGPTFHICKAHKKLRLYLLLGILPTNFNCFISNSQCEMTKYLKTKHDVFWKLNIVEN